MPHRSKHASLLHAVRRGTVRVFLLAALLALVCGCSPYKFAGDQLFKFGEKAIMPHALAGTELEIGCRAATSFIAPAIAFEGVGTDVNQIGVLLLLTGGVCTEFIAQEEELTFLRAMRAQQPYAGQDARIAQKRALGVAAKREYAAYQRFLAHYGSPREGHCPKFKKDFDELVFMVGLLAGMQAMLNDAQTGQFISVPRDIAPNVGHMVTCLNSDKWWDVPLAVRAALWYTVPMLAPENVEPMPIMEAVAQRGARDGVRLGHVVWAMAAYNAGDMITTKRAIREFVAAGDTPGYMPNKQYRLLDVIAERILLGVSDRIWTENAGYRTPIRGLGTFPDDPAKMTAGGIDDLLP